MKFSKKWLQLYIVEDLPSEGQIKNTLNKKAFEVEDVSFYPGLQDIHHDTIFDIKVLPNRAHDALGHRGMAKELCADFGYTFKEDIRIEKSFDLFTSIVPAPSVAVDDTLVCTRFMSVKIDKVKVEKSPLWLKDSLTAIGQRSINNIVDITNYVQFALNKPMHAYDARSITGTLRVRLAKSGEVLVTLDDKELSLDESTLVIADDEKVLGLAGIKGGKYSGVKDDTTSVILESANFAPVLVRKTSQKYGIKTDASKRFENGIAHSLVEEGLYMTVNIIKELFPQAVVSIVADVYPRHDTPYHVGISLHEVNSILGAVYTSELVEKTLKQLSFLYEKIIPEVYMKELHPTLVGSTYKNPSSMRYDAPESFSCSSLISYLYKGVWMPSLSIDKYVFSKKITKDELGYGDLLFTNSGEGTIRFESVAFLRGTKVPEGIDHVGMYIGDNTVIHATKGTGTVVTETLEAFSTNRSIVGYGRVVEDLKEERYVVTVPPERLDIRIKEDLAEEIGRIIGYDTLVKTLPPLSVTGLLPKRTYYENKVREVLLAYGFSEVMTYTFGNEGVVALAKGLADDKEKLRTNLSTGLLQSLSLNLYNAPLLGTKSIRIFEFGNIFRQESERKHFAFGGTSSNKKEKEALSLLVDVLHKSIYENLKLGLVNYQIPNISGNTSILEEKNSMIIELDFDTLLESLPEPTTYESPTFASCPAVTYQAISPYPFIARDIAMWVPDTTTWESIYTLCTEVGNLLVIRIDLFDTFSKEIEGVTKISYAFRLVFQSHEKTLADDEVNQMMEPYYKMLKEKGYEIR